VEHIARQVDPRDRIPMVTGLFRDRESAERAYGSVSSRRYGQDDLNVLMSDETRSRWFPPQEAEDMGSPSKALEGAATGAAIGGALGGILVAVAAVTSVTIPGFGVVVAGPMVAALTGAAAGGSTGGLIGAMIGAGIPEDRAHRYETGLREGGIVLGVTPRSSEDAAYFEQEWRQHRGEDVYRTVA
jgi:hypothetical protein